MDVWRSTRSSKYIKVSSPNEYDEFRSETLVDSWYKTNIADKNLGDKVADVIFCNDRSTPGKTATGWSSDTGLGYGSNYTAYGATARTNVWNSDASKVQPRFTCPQRMMPSQ